ncbi:hypothetical protein SNOG_07453 [Parastagonospora nodorum SN15]|uniref:DUF1996 domain-containing protein n=1 Tax=Phaeosphaeria nodorum (strain SN15 / ATCC MYA-4574 / FGSC 10173) TaxID=321614 RepID=Q0ULB1_PHANO|nr:hypothetical protein SNOG_07453 [Parastagonospora nodorum SN15]EAT84919.2 hypothetical protein SNOG_07453 [Parastagonospora nodorum SN15]
MLTNLVALTAGLASTASAFTCTGNYFSFFNRGGDAMTYQRLDPILQPGTQGTHMHSFDGGNVLSASMGFADTQAATCTTARIKTDKSLYWRPTLYWNGNGTGFHLDKDFTYKYGDGDKWANVTEFPGQFNMIAGVPEKRADGDNPAGVRWGCHNPDGRSDKIFANGFPTGFQSCDYGFASEVTFPSCWNGKPLDPENPNAHMAYPTNGGGVGVENCPITHRAARFPTVFIEFWYDISSFNKQLLLRPGGCNCGCGCGQEEMEQCFGSENVNKNEDTAWAKCGLENAGGENSPGCNPIQAGPGPATKASGAGCDANDLPASGGAKSSAASYAVASMASATSSATVAPSASSSKAVNNDSNTKVSLSISLGNKGLSEAPAATPVASPEQQYGNAPSVPSAPAKPDTPAGSELPSLSLATTPAASKPTGGANGDCKAPIYVTLTPTVYVTAGSNATSCGMGTVTKTMTETATVTVAAASGIQYGSY